LFRFIEKSKAVHFGLDGGKAGLRNYALLQPRDGGEFEALKIAGLDLQAGDKIVAIGGGGGGYGDPVERDPEAVLKDVINDYVSVESARNDYKVIIDPETLRVDIAATERLREKSE
jgi:N-methylhydantoinase B